MIYAVPALWVHQESLSSVLPVPRLSPAPHGVNRNGAEQFCVPFTFPLSPPSSQNPLEFDDPVYGRKAATLTRPAATRGQEGLENIYELISGDHPSPHASGSSNS